jgi:ParB/RepB/Spo0J family partition protein
MDNALPQQIDLQLCHPAECARSLDPNAIEALAASITECGLRSPITVRRCPKGFEVVAGMHRVHAFRRLQRATIPAFVVDADDIDAELMLIDENLCRNDLSVAERSAAQARRKHLYLLKHPETAHGGDRKLNSSRQLGDLKNNDQPVERYTQKAATATNTSERSVQREVQRGEKLGADVLAKVARTSLDKSDELDAVAKLGEIAPDRQADLIDRAKAGEKVSAKVELKKVRRDSREAELGEKIAAGNLALPDRQFGIIVADPPWGRTVYSTETGMDRHAANHYPVASGDEATQDDAIKALPVASIAASDCVLGLWCTEPWRGEAVMRAWGFKPAAYFVWVKDVVVAEPAANGMLRSGQRIEVVGAAGLGYWNRDRCEIMLIGTLGTPVCPAQGTQGERVWFARRGEHSDKPDCALEWFERHWPNTPKIELNSRRPRLGWTAWGLDATTEEAA